MTDPAPDLVAAALEYAAAAARCRPLIAEARAARVEALKVGDVASEANARARLDAARDRLSLRRTFLRALHLEVEAAIDAA